MIALGIKHDRESRSESGRSRPTLGPLQKVRGGAAQGAVLTPTKYSAVKSYLQERLERMGLGVMVGDRV